MINKIAPTSLIACLAFGVWGSVAYGQFSGQMVQEYSLLQALQATFDNNPKMKANEYRMDALRERTQAAWQSLWPTLSLGLSLTRSSSTSARGEIRESSDRLSKTLSVGVNWSLYNPGAIEAARAAEARQNAQLETFSSTSSHMQNSKGSLSNDVVEIYTDIMMARERKKFLLEEIGSPMHRLLALATDGSYRIRVTSALNSLKTTVGDVDRGLKTFSHGFQFIVTIPLPAQLQSFSEVIEDLEIPSVPEEALQIALQKSHEVRGAQLSFEAADLNYQAQKKRERWGRIDLNLNLNQSDTNSGPHWNDDIQSQGAVLGITYRQDFNLQNSSLARAARADREVARSERADILATLTFDISRYYEQLEGYLESQQSYEVNFRYVKENINQALTELQSGADPQKIDLVLNLLEELKAHWGMKISNQQNILMTKFRIQKTIGTLF